MHTKIAVLGAGRVGRAIAIDLAIRYEVTCFDISPENLQLLACTTVQTKLTNLTDYETYPALLSGFQLVISAVPGYMGYLTLKAIINASKDVADISFFAEDGLQLHELAIQKNVTAIFDCGVAPGMSNLILGYHNASMQIDSFECMVGGLPIKRVKPFEYKAPFSPIDVIEEYTRPARFVQNGHVVIKPALSDVTAHTFNEVGTLESFNTDGLRSILYTMAHIPNMIEKTLRYPGHVALIQSLQQAGFFSEAAININDITLSPLAFTSAILFKNWLPEVGEKEFTLMNIKITGEGKIIDYLLYDKYDAITHTTSMSRTTGYACSAFAQLIIDKLFIAKGAYPPELIGSNTECFTSIIKYLAAHNINYLQTVTTF